MFRVALRFNPDGIGMWSVTKCYDVRKEAEPFTLPVHVEREHGRRRLMLLTPSKVPTGTWREPLEILNGYLLELPVEVKIARESEMRRAA